VGRETLDPILFLLQSHDIEVQRAASAALGNLAVNSKYTKKTTNDDDDDGTHQFPLFFIVIICLAENKLLIVKLGGLEQLIRQMGSPNVEVQCNAVGCITNLATHGMFPPHHYFTITKTKQTDTSSFVDENKAKIAKSDALRLLVDLARSKDQRVQRNATGALLNMTHTRK
jgi:vacuolar protein 8